MRTDIDQINLSLLGSVINWTDGPPVIVIAGRQETERVSTPHHHVRGQLFGSLRGLLTVGVEDAVWVVPSIHAVWLPPHHKHWASSHGPFEGWSAYVAEELCAALPEKPCTVRTSGLLLEAVMRAAQWPLDRQVPLAPPQERIAQVILDELAALPAEPLGLPMPRDARLLRIAQSLVADPAQPRDLEAWAIWGAVSSRTLSRRFVAETGFTFTAWRQRARLMRALEMLAAGAPVSTIALDLGYSTASAFIGVFRQAFGQTPANYRQQMDTGVRHRSRAERASAACPQAISSDSPAGSSSRCPARSATLPSARSHPGSSSPAPGASA